MAYHMCAEFHTATVIPAEELRVKISEDIDGDLGRQVSQKVQSNVGARLLPAGRVFVLLTRERRCFAGAIKLWWSCRVGEDERGGTGHGEA